MCNEHTDKENAHTHAHTCAHTHIYFPTPLQEGMWGVTKGHKAWEGATTLTRSTRLGIHQTTLETHTDQMASHDEVAAE